MSGGAGPSNKTKTDIDDKSMACLEETSYYTREENGVCLFDSVVTMWLL